MLMRSRETAIGSTLVDIMEIPNVPVEPTPMEGNFIFNSEDNLVYDNEELAPGLASVLVKAEQNMFAQKQIVCIAKPNGHITLGSNYIKLLY